MITSSKTSSTQRCKVCGRYSKKEEDKQTLQSLLKDPYFNVTLRLPDSDILIERIRNDEVLLGYFRPDKSPKREYYLKNRPTQEMVLEALKKSVDGLHGDTIWRTARDEGVLWQNNRDNPLETLKEIALVVFSRYGTLLRKG